MWYYAVTACLSITKFTSDCNIKIGERTELSFSILAQIGWCQHRSNNTGN